MLEFKVQICGSYSPKDDITFIMQYTYDNKDITSNSFKFKVFKNYYKNKNKY